ncbi:MAG: hypothetical protein BHV68_11295 [Bacteroidales bacterium 43_8]|nr:MAG: hypothetical protein BHV68_11295 [Bacteroidales bacterium 43_8]
MDIKQIINEFRSLESTTHKDNTYNGISLFDMLHKLGPNTIRELLSVEYDMECTINEVSGNSILRKFAIITLRSSDKHLQSYFIEIFAMMLMKMPQQPSKQELSIEVERLVAIFSALSATPRKKIQGLWAELLVIERSLDPQTLINAWHSIPSSKYDFTLGRDKIEVKSTSSEERVHQFSLDQLNPSPSSRLLIASITVRESGQDRLYTIIAQTLGNDINKIDAVCFDYITASDTLAFYDYQMIPRILKKDVPSNISEVRFVCNITKLKDITTSNSFDKNDSQLFNSLF